MAIEELLTRIAVASEASLALLQGNAGKAGTTKPPAGKTPPKTKPPADDDDDPDTDEDGLTREEVFAAMKKLAGIKDKEFVNKVTKKVANTDSIKTVKKEDFAALKAALDRQIEKFKPAEDDPGDEEF